MCTREAYRDWRQANNWGCRLRGFLRQRRILSLLSIFPNNESRTPKHGFWLMRGAQPATSAGARLFAGSPIPAFLTIPQRAVKKSILNLLFKLAARCTSECPLFFARGPRICPGKCAGKLIHIAMDQFCRNILNDSRRTRSVPSAQEFG
jgi:hypothetical protein